MIGMLWWDNDPKSDLASKIYHAMDFYLLKYGARPNLCFVHPSMIAPRTEAWISGCEVRTAQNIMPNNFYLVVDQEGK